MKNNEQPYFIRWAFYADGTSDPPPTTKPEPSQEPKEHPKFDYDKLIAESDGLYWQWWNMWKRIHPEWALHPEKPKEPIIKPPPKPKEIFKPLSCNRCRGSRTPRSTEPPVQSPTRTHPYP